VPALLRLLGDSDQTVSTAMLQNLAPRISGGRGGSAAWAPLVFRARHVQALLDALEALARSPRWRARKAVSCVLPLLVAACHTVEQRERAAALAAPLVSDPVFEVRVTASFCLCRAAAADFGDRPVTGDPNIPGSVVLSADGEPVQDMGRMWLDGVVLPLLESLRTSRTYGDRVVSLHMIAALLSDGLIEEDDVRCEILLSIALTLATDRVPNVRMAFARAMQELAPLLRRKLGAGEGAAPAGPNELPSAFAAAVDKTRELRLDADRDVRHFAEGAVERLDSA